MLINQNHFGEVFYGQMRQNSISSDLKAISKYEEEEKKGKGEALKLKNLNSMIKHGGGGVMAWSSMD